MYLKDFKNILRIKRWSKGACVASNSIVGSSFFHFSFFFSFSISFPFFSFSPHLSFFHFHVFLHYPLLLWRPFLGSCFGLIPRTVNDPFGVSLSFRGRSGALHDVPCFGCAVLFFQCGMAQHQNHCQAYQVLLPNDVPSSSISSLAPSTPPKWPRLGFWC